MHRSEGVWSLAGNDKYLRDVSTYCVLVCWTEELLLCSYRLHIFLDLGCEDATTVATCQCILAAGSLCTSSFPWVTGDCGLPSVGLQLLRARRGSNKPQAATRRLGELSVSSLPASPVVPTASAAY